MRHRWKWISVVLIAAVLGVGRWVRQRPTSPAALGPIAPATAPTPLDPMWPAGISRAAVEAARQGDQSDEIEVCGVGKVKLDRDDPTAAGTYLNALTKNSRLRWLAALRNSDD